MQEMPTGTFVRRKDVDNFKPTMAQKYGVMATEWLEWEAKINNVHIDHKFNNVEKRVGARRLPVDGFCRETNTVWQFQGCYWHGHRCHLNPNDYNEVRQVSSEILRKETESNSAYIRKQGYHLKEIRECEWQTLQQHNPDLRKILDSCRLPHSRRKEMC